LFVTRRRDADASTARRRYAVPYAAAAILPFARHDALRAIRREAAAATPRCLLAVCCRYARYARGARNDAHASALTRHIRRC